MSTIIETQPLFDLMVGGLIVSAILLKTWFDRIGVPALVGLLVLGLLIRIADDKWALISVQSTAIFDFLARIGVVVLLFKVGLECNPYALVSKLRQAVPIWVGNVALSGLGGYLVAAYGLGLPQVPSLFIAIALTATTVAVSAAVWEEAGALNSVNGALLLDVAELDDVSAIFLMALLIAVVPVLETAGLQPIMAAMLDIGWAFIVKTVVFGAGCLGFAMFVERRVTRLIRKAGPPDAILVVVGIGIVIASVAATLGLSLAIGALFAGLVFSRDPRVVHMNTLFRPIHDLFTPFFFISIGMAIEPSSLGSASLVGGVLLGVAVLGKLIGAGLPAWPLVGWRGATLIGVSMVPRAEIAMIVVHQGHRLGPQALPPDAYGAMALIVAVTCVVAPIMIRILLQRWPQEAAPSP